MHTFSREELKKRCTSSVVALIAGNGLERILRFIRVIVLARLIIREELGLAVIVLMVTQLLESLMEVGIQQSIIQNKMGGQPEFQNVTFWFQLVRSIIIYIPAYCFAPEIGEFFGNRDLAPLLRAAFLCIVFNATVSPGVYVLEKKMEFGKSVLFWQGTGVIGTIITLILVLIRRDIWAIVIGSVLESGIRTGFSFILCPFKPALKLDRVCLKELWTFAGRMFGLPILTMIAFQLDAFVLGKMVSKELLATYYLAYQLARMPRELFAQIVGKIVLPVFSQIQEDSARLCRLIGKMNKGIALLGLPVLFFLMGGSKALLSVIYTAQDASVSVPFCILLIVAWLRVQGVVLASVYIAIGQPHYHRSFVGLRALILAAVIYPAIKYWGLTGAASAVLISEAIGSMAQIYMMKKSIGLQYFCYYQSWLPGLAGGICVAVFMWMIFEYVPYNNNWFILISGTFISLVTVGIIALILKYITTKSSTSLKQL